MNAIRNRNSAFCMLLVLGSVLLPNPVKAATVYWGFCSVMFDGGWKEYDEHGVIEYNPYRPIGGVLDVLDYDNPDYHYGVPNSRWVSIVRFSVDYDLEQGIVMYSGGLSGSAKFGETVRLYYSVLLLEDGSTPAVGFVDFLYEDEPIRDIRMVSSYVSIGADAALPIPEPCSGGMMMLGFAFFPLRRRSA